MSESEEAMVDPDKPDRFPSPMGEADLSVGRVTKGSPTPSASASRSSATPPCPTASPVSWTAFMPAPSAALPSSLVE